MRPDAAPTGPGRILSAYVAVLAGVPAVLLMIPAMIAGSRCEAEGLACLGWLVYGGLAVLVVAAVVHLVVAVRLRLGWVHPLLVTALLTAVVLAPGEETVRVVAGLVVPAAVALVTDPGRRGGVRPARAVLAGLAVLALLAGVLTLAAAVQDRRAASAREQHLAAEDVTAYGLGDDSGWSYDYVVESPVDDGVTQALRDGEGRRIRIESRADAAALRSADPASSRLVEHDGGATLVQVREGTFSDAELDALAADLVPRSARWLAERECWSCW